MTALLDADSGAPQPWKWAIGNIELEVRVGNLPGAPETYLVNSANSAFRLARGTRSISGQFRRAHPIMQAELDAQTSHQWLPEGSVLETSGPDGHRVYHAGFHAPNGWMTNFAEDEVAYYAGNIERCVEKILESVAAIEVEDRRSVAFPLIGTGSFRLREEVSARFPKHGRARQGDSGFATWTARPPSLNRSTSKGGDARGFGRCGATG
jgi:hypothetical protein